MSLAETRIPGLLVVVRDAWQAWDAMSPAERQAWMTRNGTQVPEAGRTLSSLESVDSWTVVPAPTRTHRP